MHEGFEVKSSPVVAARDRITLKLRDEDGTGETVRVAELTISSPHPHDTHAAGEYLVDLGGFPERVAALLNRALMLLAARHQSGAEDVLVDLRAEASRIAERGELEGL